MGAGKSRTVRWLHSEGHFPLHRFVIVEADLIKSELPEMKDYLRENRRLAGTLLHRESCFIAEILEREALARRMNVLVDSSLRDAQWYEGVFRRLRATRPHYRIAILMVTATQETVFARVERRAAVTGRDVPREVLHDAISRVPQSFARLSPLVDYAAVIENDIDGSPPQLTQEISPQRGISFSADQTNRTKEWNRLRMQFNDSDSSCHLKFGEEEELNRTLQRLLARSHAAIS